MKRSFALLKPLDQAAIRCAINGEVWAKQRIADFNADQRFLADLICQWYFETTFSELVAAG